MGNTDEPLVQALHDHPKFEPDETAFTLTSATLQSSVTVDDGTLRVRVWIPTLRSVISGEPPSMVVEDAWFDALERRLLNGYDVTRSTAATEAEVKRTDTEVVVTYAIESDTPMTAVDDAKALIEYVVGTYVQGAIPGYDYEAPLGDLLRTAIDRGQNGAQSSG